MSNKSPISMPFKEYRLWIAERVKPILRTYLQKDTPAGFTLHELRDWLADRVPKAEQGFVYELSNVTLAGLVQSLGLGKVKTQPKPRSKEYPDGAPAVWMRLVATGQQAEKPTEPIPPSPAVVPPPPYSDQPTRLPHQHVAQVVLEELGVTIHGPLNVVAKMIFAWSDYCTRLDKAPERKTA